MKEQLRKIDATPTKRLYLSIIADYDIYKSISELIDNAVDIWTSSGQRSPLSISISLDMYQQRIEVVDNAGGVEEGDLSFVVGPGHTANIGHEQTIGIFGVGTKRAVVALAQMVSIRTRRHKETFLIELDDSWIDESDDWRLPVYKGAEVPQGTTVIELTKLRSTLSPETETNLVAHIGATYAKFLKTKNLEILVNGVKVKPILFENWAYPPDYRPMVVRGKLKFNQDESVEIEAIAGLCQESSPAGGEYGVYVYCNSRLIARGLKTFDVGFATGLAGKPHADISLARVLVSIKGPANLMPWNSSKSDINPSHQVFTALRPTLLQLVKSYTSLSRRLSKFEGGWHEHVFKYKIGEPRVVKEEAFPDLNASYLPPLPAFRRRYSAVVEQQNRDIAESKPWVVGLYETIIAVDLVLKQDLIQKNRIALILLDSNLEIAFKEYLANEVSPRIGNARLEALMKNRHQVHKEMKTHVEISETDWGKIEFYYATRNQLVHRRATVSISDHEISDFRGLVQKVLKRMFNLELAK